MGKLTATAIVIAGVGIVTGALILAGNDGGKAEPNAPLPIQETAEAQPQPPPATLPAIAPAAYPPSLEVPAGLPGYTAGDPLADVPDEVILAALGEFAHPGLADQTRKEELVERAHTLAQRMESRWDEYGPGESARIPLDRRLAMVKLTFQLIDSQRRAPLDQSAVADSITSIIQPDSSDLLTLSFLDDASRMYSAAGDQAKAGQLAERVISLMESRRAELPSLDEAKADEQEAAVKLAQDVNNPELQTAYWNARGQTRLIEELPEVVDFLRSKTAGSERQPGPEAVPEPVL